MQELHLPGYAFKVRSAPQGEQIFDLVRRKYVALTPEEWVRQHFLNFLIDHRGCPASLIKVERGIPARSIQMRADIIIHGTDGKPAALVECKSPDVTMNEGSFAQVIRYNSFLKTGYIILTNGLVHYCCKLVDGGNTVVPQVEIPTYKEMVELSDTIRK